MGQALDHYDSQQQIHLVDSNEEDDEGEGGGGSATQLRLVGDWSQGLTAENIQERLILAHRNSDVNELNQAAREKMQALGLLDKDSKKVVTTNHNVIELSTGDRILFLRNDRQLGISNGEFATISKMDGDKITVKLGKASSREMTFSTNEYQDFNYGYAATVHKSQGSTYDQVFVYVAGRCWDRSLSYVAMTRHRKALNVYADRSQFRNLTELKDGLSRSTIRDSVLDWPLSFAIRRGFDPEKLIGWFVDKVLGVKQAIHDVWLFVANYQAFKVRKAHHHSVQDKIKQRALAKKVAMFVDLRNQLGAQARQMRRNLKSYEKFYDHPGYKDWYERTLIRNQSAYEIKQDYELFKDALNLNRVSDRALEKLATQHERAILVKDYLAQSQERVFKKVKTIAPELAKTFEKINTPIKEVTINWTSEEFNDEFDALRKSKDSKHQYLVKFRDKLKNNSYKQYEKMLTKQLDSLAMNIGEVKSRQESLKKLAPNLFSKLEAFVKFKTRQKEIERDFD